MGRWRKKKSWKKKRGFRRAVLNVIEDQEQPHYQLVREKSTFLCPQSNQLMEAFFVFNHLSAIEPRWKAFALANMFGAAATAETLMLASTAKKRIDWLKYTILMTNNSISKAYIKLIPFKFRKPIQTSSGNTPEDGATVDHIPIFSTSIYDSPSINEYLNDIIKRGYDDLDVTNNTVSDGVNTANWGTTRPDQDNVLTPWYFNPSLCQNCVQVGKPKEFILQPGEVWNYQHTSSRRGSMIEMDHIFTPLGLQATTNKVTGLLTATDEHTWFYLLVCHGEVGGQFDTSNPGTTPIQLDVLASMELKWYDILSLYNQAFGNSNVLTFGPDPVIFVQQNPCAPNTTTVAAPSRLPPVRANVAANP